MKTLMLLGGSQCQLSAAKAVKAMGHRLVLADYLPDPPALRLCDAHARVSTFDAPACIAAAREHQVDGVFTVGTDQPVYTAARVAEALGLPSPISADTALRATNKRAMKQAFALGGVPALPYAFLSPGQSADTLAALPPPLVLKPLDSQGQRGIFRVANAAEAVRRLPETLSYSREQAALVEPFYPSEEVTFSGYLHNGRLYPLTLTDRQLLSDPTHIGVCAAHRYPSKHARLMPQIEAIAAQVAGALHAAQGPLYIQLLIGDRGIVVNEAALRVGGAFEDAFIPLVSGFDLLGAVIRLALGEAVPPPETRPAAGAWQVSVQMLFCRPATVAGMTPLPEVLSLPGVLTAGYNYGVGDAVPQRTNATARFGHCVLVSDRGDMPALVQNLYRALRVWDAQGNPMLLPRTFDGAEECHA